MFIGRFAGGFLAVPAVARTYSEAVRTVGSAGHQQGNRRSTCTPELPKLSTT